VLGFFFLIYYSHVSTFSFFLFFFSTQVGTFERISAPPLGAVLPPARVPAIQPCGRQRRWQRFFFG
jgi:hypothetical protein